MIDQEDVFYACWVPTFEVSDAGHTEDERRTLTAWRWWTRDELATTDELVWPVAVLEMWADADARRAAVDLSRPPLDGGTVEESSVEVG